MTRIELKEQLQGILKEKYQDDLDLAMDEWAYDYSECRELGQSMEIPGAMTISGNPILINTEDEIL